ncbi:MAG: peptidoglycan synthetase [Bacteroidia bacterium]|nr:peptidoglycan synthetase [Bacteroidia bacterium]
MKVHFIAIGGSVMHNLAITLHKKGFQISGSDDEIFEPSHSRLEKYCLMPEKDGWFPEKISTRLDAIILGMHARLDNPELIKAQELGIKIYSYPEYIYEQCKSKRRVVIGGSHGKTTITSMIMHVLNFHGIDFDYLVGSQLEGFETMVRLSDTAKIAIFEGDEYLASPIDKQPKFLVYKPNIGLISGIAWDHINVFPVFEDYVEQFRLFVEKTDSAGALIYCECDKTLVSMLEKIQNKVKQTAYRAHPAFIRTGQTFLDTKYGEIPLQIFGEHNLQNINGARLVCNETGIADEQFYKAIQSFKGASKRLQLLAQNEHTKVFLDFAHSPSKLNATIKAVKEQYPEQLLVACMELHTFSSLNENYLGQYHGTMENADIAYVYFNPETIKHKRLKEISVEQILFAFGGRNLEVFTDSEKLLERLLKLDWKGKILLLMTSGNFSVINCDKISALVTA